MSFLYLPKSEVNEASKALWVDITRGDVHVKQMEDKYNQAFGDFILSISRIYEER